MHIAEVFEHAASFELVHNHFDFLPLSYSRPVEKPHLTTIHSFSSEQILPIYQHYNEHCYYVSISDADRHPSLDYIATVYHAIELEAFTLKLSPETICFTSVVSIPTKVWRKPSRLPGVREGR